MCGARSSPIPSYQVYIVLTPTICHPTLPPGTPDLLLTFTNAKVLDDCSFHPCVRYDAPFLGCIATISTTGYLSSLQRWTRDKALSFVPPDGHFTLMEYRFVPTPTSAVITTPASIPIPLTLKPVVKLDENGGARFPLTHELSLKDIFRLIGSHALITYGWPATGPRLGRALPRPRRHSSELRCFRRHLLDF